MSSIARYARVKAAECERYAATARDPESRQQYIQLARDWWEMARQGDRLRAKRLRTNTIIDQELRAYYQACRTEEPPPRLLVLLKKLDEETEPSAEQVG
jgi:hypothetical protein